MKGFDGKNLPVTGVNNQDAVAFCKWLSKREGRTYRVPRYYEFEFANRAGADQRFWWGKQPDVRKMNFGRSLIGHPTPVGSYPPNPWGFYDLHGNVWQYCINDGRTDSHGRGRWGGWGSAFNSPSRMTGADAWSNFNEGPNLMRLLSAGFRLACDADQGTARPRDLKKPTIVAAGNRGQELPELEVTVGKRIDMGPIPTNAAFFMATANGTWILNNKRSADKGKTWQACEPIGEAFCQLRDGTIISMPGGGSPETRLNFPDPLSGKSTLPVRVSTDDWKTVKTFRASFQVPLGPVLLPGTRTDRTRRRPFADDDVRPHAWRPDPRGFSGRLRTADSLDQDAGHRRAVERPRQELAISLNGELQPSAGFRGTERKRSKPFAQWAVGRVHADRHPWLRRQARPQEPRPAPAGVLVGRQRHQLERPAANPRG
ncbi:MAG: hypothetical protein CM1200mP2_31460 [Planctomycetaceae bacterium]|nr:MAG: hypothetical protein CM1200mP2_31460 [Planctomycetaceae bacterium]